MLGDKDELVIVAGDAGDSAGAADWPADTQARLNLRYTITVTDPPSASQQAWAVENYKKFASPQYAAMYEQNRAAGPMYTRLAHWSLVTRERAPQTEWA